MNDTINGTIANTNKETAVQEEQQPKEMSIKDELREMNGHLKDIAESLLYISQHTNIRLH